MLFLYNLRPRFTSGGREKSIIFRARKPRNCCVRVVYPDKTLNGESKWSPFRLRKLARKKATFFWKILEGEKKGSLFCGQKVKRKKHFFCVNRPIFSKIKQYLPFQSLFFPLRVKFPFTRGVKEVNSSWRGFSCQAAFFMPSSRHLFFSSPEGQFPRRRGLCGSFQYDFDTCPAQKKDCKNLPKIAEGSICCLNSQLFSGGMEKMVTDEGRRGSKWRHLRGLFSEDAFSLKRQKKLGLSRHFDGGLKRDGPKKT